MRYEGRSDGTVTVEGKRLDPRFDLFRHSPDGFAWGYGGSGPAQLSIAIVAHHMKGVSPGRLDVLKRKAGWNGTDAEPDLFLSTCTWPDFVAIRLYQAFKASVVARLPQNQGFTLTSEQIDAALDTLATREKASG